MNFASDKASFCEIQVKNFTLKVLSEVFFINFVFFVICCMLSYPNFAILSFNDSYTGKGAF